MPGSAPGQASKAPALRRRHYLRSAGAVLAGSAVIGSTNAGADRTDGAQGSPCDKGPGLSFVRPDPTPYLVDVKTYRRPAATATVLNLARRAGHDYRRAIFDRARQRAHAGHPGFSYADIALCDAAGAAGGRISFTGHAIDFRLDEVGFSFADAHPTPILGDSPLGAPPEELTALVKRAARFLGADLVGVTRLDPRWVYTEVWLNDSRRTRLLELPPGLGFAVVLAFEMDYDTVALTPTMTSFAVTVLGYSRMAATVWSLARFIRNLGYQAVACGNDTALSVPLAIDAGLGEMSRPGLVVTPEFGARVRLAKVLTDMPLVPDGPVQFGVRAFCRKCKKCAQACPARAIPTTTEPTWTGPSRSNNPGVYKWYVDVDRCLEFWQANGSDCLVCVKDCPFNQPPNPWREALAESLAPGSRAWLPTEGPPAVRRARGPEEWWCEDRLGGI